jgi:hypothetical protein
VCRLIYSPNSGPLSNSGTKADVEEVSILSSFPDVAPVELQFAPPSP